MSPRPTATQPCITPLCAACPKWYGYEIVTTGDHVTHEERVEFATAAIDAGARFDLRDEALRSTPHGWACRWGREELVELFLARGADPVEASAEPWATPVAWAEKKGHPRIAALLRRAR